MNAEGIMLAVGAVIQNDAGQILLARHRPEREGYWKGKWICPGGKLKVGETLADGALREVREETHLEVKLQKILPPFETIAQQDEDMILHVIYVDFWAHVTGGELQPDDDIGEAQWWRRDEIFERWEELHHDTQRLFVLAGLTGQKRPWPC